MVLAGRLGVFFFNDTATTEIYTLSLHDALPICEGSLPKRTSASRSVTPAPSAESSAASWNTPATPLEVASVVRSEEHTSELQSRQYLVCRLLLEKKNLSKQYAYRHT